MHINTTIIPTNLANDFIIEVIPLPQKIILLHGIKHINISIQKKQSI